MKRKLGIAWAWPLDGILFDLEHNSYWDTEHWGPKPSDKEDQYALIRRLVDEAPTLIPIFSHRFIAAELCLAGNPVFSVWQTDIIYYGYDLENYFRNEFKASGPKIEGETFTFYSGQEPDWSGVPRNIRFWTEILDNNG